jgi:hypothetical protein
MADYSSYLLASGETPASSAKQNNLINAIEADVSALETDVAALPSAVDPWQAAGETWTYVSATTFTIPSDKTGKYTRGMRIRLTQSATVKYFLVVSSSYGAPNTTVTVDGRGAYTLANAAISSPYYAHAWAPAGLPAVFLTDEYTYDEFTAPVAVAAATEATATTVVTATAYTFDGATPVVVEFFAPAAVRGTNRIAFVLYDGAASIGILANEPNVQGAEWPVFVARRLTPSAAAHTYSVRAFVDAGAGTVTAGAGGVGNYMPGYIRIRKA